MKRFIRVCVFLVATIEISILLEIRFGLTEGAYVLAIPRRAHDRTWGCQNSACHGMSFRILHKDVDDLLNQYAKHTVLLLVLLSFLGTDLSLL